MNAATTMPPIADAAQGDHVSSQSSSAALTVRVVPTTFVTITAVAGGIEDFHPR